MKIDKSFKTRSVNICRLNNGLTVEFDLCSQTITDEFHIYFNLLGYGVIYSVDGVLQNSTRLMYFWKAKS